MNGKEVARIDGGSCFGELALLRQEPRAATVSAMTDAKVRTHTQLLLRDVCCCQLSSPLLGLLQKLHLRKAAHRHLV